MYKDTYHLDCIVNVIIAEQGIKTLHQLLISNLFIYDIYHLS